MPDSMVETQTDSRGERSSASGGRWHCRGGELSDGERPLLWLRGRRWGGHTAPRPLPGPLGTGLQRRAPPPGTPGILRDEKEREALVAIGEVAREGVVCMGSPGTTRGTSREEEAEEEEG